MQPRGVGEKEESDPTLVTEGEAFSIVSRSQKKVEHSGEQKVKEKGATLFLPRKEGLLPGKWERLGNQVRKKNNPGAPSMLGKRFEPLSSRRGKRLFLIGTEK